MPADKKVLDGRLATIEGHIKGPARVADRLLGPLLRGSANQTPRTSSESWKLSTDAHDLDTERASPLPSASSIR